MRMATVGNIRTRVSWVVESWSGRAVLGASVLKAAAIMCVGTLLLSLRGVPPSGIYVLVVPKLGALASLCAQGHAVVGGVAAGVEYVAKCVFAGVLVMPTAGISRAPQTMGTRCS
jgi:hypothetical protein